jgi:hypothetical protein
MEKWRKKDKGLSHARAPQPPVRPWLVVEQTLVRIFLSNSYTFCLE